MPSRPLYISRRAWEADAALSMCSDGAKFLWFKLLMLMNDLEPRGQLLIAGKMPDDRQIAALTRTNPDHTTEWLGELEWYGVLKRNRRGVIYSEALKAQIAPLPNATRKAVLKRDGSVCGYCGDTAGPFEIDHVTPRKMGGTNDHDNLKVACRDCNRSKRAKSVEEWLAENARG